MNSPPLDLSAQPFQSLAQMNVRHLHCVFLSFTPDGPIGRGHIQKARPQFAPGFFVVNEIHGSSWSSHRGGLGLVKSFSHDSLDTIGSMKGGDGGGAKVDDPCSATPPSRSAGVREEISPPADSSAGSPTGTLLEAESGNGGGADANELSAVFDETLLSSRGSDGAGLKKPLKDCWPFTELLCAAAGAAGLFFLFDFAEGAGAERFFPGLAVEPA